MNEADHRGVSSRASASDESLRILIAHSSYRVAGGEDRYVEQQADLLSQRHEVELVGRRNSDLGNGLPTAARMIYSHGERREIEEVIKRFRPDVVHLHNPYPALGPAVHLAAERQGIPLVMTVHNFRLRCPNGFMFTEGKPCTRCEQGHYYNAVSHHCFPSATQSASYATALWLHRFLLRLEDKIALFVAPSDFMRDRLGQWGIGSGRIEVVRNFTHLDSASSGPGNFGLYLGRLSSEKGLDVLLRALRKAGDPFFRIVGDGPEQDGLMNLATELRLRHTEFLGRLAPDRVAPLLHGCRFLAVPSLWDENAPLAALEAMAAGRPLLVSDKGGLPELVGNGEGLTCEAGDMDALAAQISRLMNETELCTTAGARALERAQDEFGPQAHLHRLEAAYARARDLH